jgi:AraC-like DNA-binding protein
MLSIRTYIPARLQRLVKLFWYLEVPAVPGGYEEEIIPDVHHEIIFHLNTLPARRLNGAGDKWHTEPAAFVAAQTVQPYRLQLLPGAKLLGIRFYPHTLFALLRLPAHELTNRIEPLGALTDEQPFWNCMHPDPDRCFEQLENLLLQKALLLNPHAAGYVYVHTAVEEITRYKGAVSVDQLVRRTGVSLKYLNNLFKQYVGLNPKMISRIVQLNHFVAYRNRHPEKTFTECCYESGYYDQSHLIKSFQLFTRRSPGAYFSHSSQINEFFTAH